MLKSKKLMSFLGIAIFAIIVSISTTFLMKESDAYEKVEEYIRNDPKIDTYIGSLTSYNIAILGGQEIHVSANSTGNAFFTVNIVGDRASGTLSINLNKVDGNWEVENSTFKAE